MRTFDILFDELATARARYEDLRKAGAPITERLDARVALDDLRVQVSAARRTGLIG